MIKIGITHRTIILSAILLAMSLLLTGCGGGSTFDGSRTSDEMGFRMEYSLDKDVFGFTAERKHDIIA